MNKNLTARLKNFITADYFKKGKGWNGYTVYIPMYKQEYIAGFPKIILEKDGLCRVSTCEECFEYIKFEKNNKRGKRFN